MSDMGFKSGNEHVVVDKELLKQISKAIKQISDRVDKLYAHLGLRG